MTWSQMKCSPDNYFKIEICIILSMEQEAHTNKWMKITCWHYMTLFQKKKWEWMDAMIESN